jgi:ATP-dependent exoDNAse (exonuclease V) alpha subunit/intein/homing endonuclease
MASINVRVDRVIHKTKDYHVVAVEILNSEPRVKDRVGKASGQICGLTQVAQGITMRFQGEWVDHPKFGRQFAIHGWSPWAQTHSDAFRFLHDCVEGFEHAQAVKMMVDAFGRDVFRVMSEQPEEILALFAPDEEALMGGVPRRATAHSMLIQWDRVRTIYELLSLLQDHGLDSYLVQAVLTRFGDDARDVLTKNPYRLLEIRGVSVSQADRVASRMGLRVDDPRRNQGAVLASVRQAAQDGHLFLRGNDFPGWFEKLSEEGKVKSFDASSASLVQAIRALKSEKAVMVDAKAGVYLPEFHRAERGSAARLAEFLRPLSIEVDPVGFLLDYQRSNRIDLSEAQREAVEKILTSRVLVLTGLPGTGKCVVPETIVSGPWGFRKIGDFLPPDLGVDSFAPLSEDIDTPGGVQRTSHVYNGGQAATIKVRTTAGFELEGTPEHRIRVVIDGNIEWRRLGCLTDKDWVVLQRGTHYSFGAEMSLPPGGEGVALREKVYRTPARMSKRLAYVLGYMTSERSTVSKRAWKITAFDYRVFGFIGRAFYSMFGYRAPFTHDHRASGISHIAGNCITSPFLIRWFRSLGVRPEYAHQKSVPAAIMCAPREIVAAYLSALFEGDGSVDPTRFSVDYGTGSKQLSIEVQTLLLAFGIVANRFECIRGGKPYFRLNIYGEDYDRFRSLIGFHFTLLPGRTCKSNTNKHVVPNAHRLIEALAREVRPAKGRAYNQFYRYGKGGSGKQSRRPSRVHLRRLLSYATEESDAVRGLRGLMDDGLFYDRVDVIEQGASPVVDFTVPEGHAFLSNGFISHNTACLRAIVNLFEAAKLSYRLMAPTGIAAKRIAAATSREAATIHRTFGFDGEQWRYNSLCKLGVNAVIIDEISMVDQDLFYRVLDALDPDTILLLVGDDAQLPSVGPGNVLRELLACPDVPHIRLTQIFRQSGEGGIVLNSHRINRGESPVLNRDDDEFKFVEMEREEDILRLIVAIAAKLKSRDENFQVIVPKYEGVVGIDRLNDVLRDQLNPDKGQPEWKAGSLHLRDGDRVMVIQNDYELGVYNGDMGKVVGFSKDSIRVKIHGLTPNDGDALIDMPKGDALQKLRLAYAVSVHRCVDPSTLVETPNGLLRAGDLPAEGFVSTPLGRGQYEGFVRNRTSSMLRITTSDGYQLSVTPDHGVDVWNPESGYSRTEAHDIKTGDFLRLRIGSEFPQNPAPVLPGPPVADVRAVLPPLPVNLTSDVAELLGYMVADGTVFDGGFRYSKAHVECTDRVALIVASAFGVEVKRYFKENEHYAEVHSAFLASWLMSVGGLAPKAKAVPSCVLAGSVELQAAFLRGLFEDGSVHVKNGKLDHIELFTVYDSIVRDVKVMLLRLGIVSGLLQRKNQLKDGSISVGHSIYIYGAYAKIYQRVVGFTTPEKMHRLEALSPDNTKYVVPVLKADIREVCDANRGPSSFMTCTDRNVYNKGRMSRHTLALFLEGAVNRPAAWQRLADSLRFHHSRVESVTEYQGPSVCVEVPDGHRFIQDGFSGWNSQGNEFHTVLMPITRTQGRMLQRNLLYTAVTRAKKRVWLIGHRDAVARAVANDRVVQRNSALGKSITEVRAGGVGKGHDDSGRSGNAGGSAVGGAAETDPGAATSA